MSTRKRSLGSQRFTPSVTWNNPKSGTKGSYSHQSAGWTGKSSVIEDTLNPGFAARRARGEIILSDMLLTVVERDDPSCSFTIGPHVSWGSNSVNGDFSSFFDTSVPDPSVGFDADILSAASLAATRARARISAPDISAGEALNDLGQTVQMLKSPLKGSIDLVKRMLKQRNKTLGKTTASAFLASKNAWLEYRYGWKPLLMDMDTIVESISAKRSPQKKAYLVARAQENFSRTFEKPFGVTGGLPRVDSVSGVVRVERSVRASAGVFYCYRNSMNQKEMAQTLGTRPRDLALSAWEIIPYSFVVDWFVNVGDWLQAVVPDPSLHILGSWTTTCDDKKTSYEELKTSTYISSSPATTFYNYPKGATYTRSTVRRTCNQSAPSTPYLTMNTLSLVHSVDAVALFVPKVMRGLSTLKHR